MTFEEAFFDELEKHAGWKEKLLAGALAGGTLLGAGALNYQTHQQGPQFWKNLEQNYPKVALSLKAGKENFENWQPSEKAGKEVIKPASIQPKSGTYTK